MSSSHINAVTLRASPWRSVIRWRLRRRRLARAEQATAGKAGSRATGGEARDSALSDASLHRRRRLRRERGETDNERARGQAMAMAGARSGSAPEAISHAASKVVAATPATTILVAGHILFSVHGVVLVVSG